MPSTLFHMTTKLLVLQGKIPNWPRQKAHCVSTVCANLIENLSGNMHHRSTVLADMIRALWRILLYYLIFHTANVGPGLEKLYTLQWEWQECGVNRGLIATK